MSGPIVRQYGVPNWDEIFGKKEEKESKADERQPQASDQPNEERSNDSADRTDK